MLITVDTFDTRVAFVPDTFTHRIFVDLGIPLGNTRGIKIDRIPSIDQRKVSFDVEPSFFLSRKTIPRETFLSPFQLNADQIFRSTRSEGRW